jgi:hypothetical protein
MFLDGDSCIPSRLSRIQTEHSQMPRPQHGSRSYEPTTCIHAPELNESRRRRTARRRAARPRAALLAAAAALSVSVSAGGQPAPRAAVLRRLPVCPSRGRDTLLQPERCRERAPLSVLASMRPGCPHVVDYQYRGWESGERNALPLPHPLPRLWHSALPRPHGYAAGKSRMDDHGMITA